MKAFLTLIFLFAALVLYLWYKDLPPFKKVVAEESPVTRLKEPRYAPDGILYVIEPFSVTTEDGIHGFPEGKKVTLLREEGNHVVVTDEIMKATAPKSSFTNDLDVVDAILEAKRQSEKFQHQQRLSREAGQFASVQKAEAENKKRKQEQRLREIATLEKALDSLNRRIEKARMERLSKGYPADGGARSRGRHVYYDGYSRRYRNNQIVTLSHDASQIENLLGAKTKLESQLRMLKNINN